MKIGFLSDLHITHNSNMIEQAVNIVVEAYKKANLDKLFIAGDISNNYKTTLKFIDMLVLEGVDAYTVFGNHEYWSISYEDAQLIEHDRYINGKTVKLKEDKVVIGIDGFFDYSFILDVDNPYTKELPHDKEMLNRYGKRAFDLKKNKIGNYSEVFLAMEKMLIESLEANRGKDITILTHYVPHHEFAIYNTDKSWTACNSFMGSNRYSELAEEYNVNRVIFGHTHNKFNRKINGVSYHCNPVGYGSFEFTDSFRDRVNSVLKVFEV